MTKYTVLGSRPGGKGVRPYLLPAVAFITILWGTVWLLHRSGKVVFKLPYKGHGETVDGKVDRFDIAEYSQWSDEPKAEWDTPTLLRLLDERYESLSIPIQLLNCSSATTPLRYSNLTIPGKQIFVALNLYNSAPILPTLSSSLLRAIDTLGRSNVFVSIYESGSTDVTPRALAHLASALKAAGIAHEVRSDDHQTDWDEVDRIAQLAAYRNIALAPFTTSSTPENFSDLLFLNDIYFCPEDLLELLYQRRTQNADATCGTDWVRTESPFATISGTDPIHAYDNWVLRTLSGLAMRDRIDPWIFWEDGWDALWSLESGEQGKEWKDRWNSGLPVPVYSCWNGAIALNPEPFVDAGVRFRNADPAAVPAECPASECSLLAKDFWRHGYRRWLLVPRVAVSYERSTYDHPLLVEGTRRQEEPRSKEEEVVQWTEQEPEKVVCWPWYPRATRAWWQSLWINRWMEEPY